MTIRATRVEALDYLRGLLALAVMIYHYVGWVGVELDATSVLSRLGFYAVSSFYILSGLSLGHVYRSGFASRAGLVQYSLHRAFRIVPLFWIVVTLSLLLMVVPSIIRGDEVPTIDFVRVFLNYTLLFGFVQPDAYFSTGAWSIGNEVVFYVLFPLLMLSRKAVWLWVAMMLSLVTAFYFTSQIGDSQSWKYQWPTYINPLNQLSFFVAGMLIARLGTARTMSGAWLGVFALFAGVTLFLFHRVVGADQNLVSLVNRPYFFLACVLVVTGVYRANDLLARIPFINMFSLLGACTYSVYLLHPFVFVAVTRFLGIGWFGSVAAGILTIVISWMSYNWFELPIMRAGKKLGSRIDTRLHQATPFPLGEVDVRARDGSR